eukprot:TRINITY_DN12698_c0_g1_i21.p5 TRINITY_DN12698_c0_g1~~TRINITY_DN12698_c0_g1_i21.p5  ORF type:complete len:103 (-),score=12.25 TRINITY_DN12698_c0_g1_i21:699-1007(-)
MENLLIVLSGRTCSPHLWDVDEETIRDLKITLKLKGESLIPCLFFSPRLDVWIAKESITCTVSIFTSIDEEKICSLDTGSFYENFKFDGERGAFMGNLSFIG